MLTTIRLAQPNRTGWRSEYKKRTCHFLGQVRFLLKNKGIHYQEAAAQRDVREIFLQALSIKQGFVLNFILEIKNKNK